MSGLTELSSEERHLAVDHELCSGTGHCQDAAPEIFRVQERWSWLREDADLAAADAGRLADAEARCPWMAITFERRERT
ncbi:ferredoxin [Streptomyces sp. NPDC048644]|uniref:ferredoxin n=1 Tax=Streptomyces sp. NPDC048644 TaxID=3365582 RepID=UPI003718796D